jgi:hypothetical protein
MPTSSPAPFWRYAELGNTPRGPIFGLSSPVKAASATLPLPASSSPAPQRDAPASPSKNSEMKTDMQDLDDDEPAAFDLTK